MNLKQAMERIAALESRIKALESRPEQHIHYHTHPAPLMPHPDLVPPPVWPNLPTYDPWRWVPPMPVTCGQIGGGTSN